MQLKRKLHRESIPIMMILAIAFFIRIAILICYGAEYSLNSDDVSYVKSAITLVHTGELTMHGVISAQIMPGVPWLIAPFVLLFGEGHALWVVIKVVWILMGIGSIYGVYRIVKMYANQWFACLASLFFLAIDFAWMDNLILTETPFMFGTIYLIWASLLLGKTKAKKYYWLIIFFYMFSLLMRPTIAPYPLFLFIYLYFCKYDMKLMIKQILIAGAIVLCFIIPWTIRNYIRFDAFIPLTYGMGNPKLLGTYQGYYAPKDEELDYVSNVMEKLPDKIKAFYESDGWENSYMAKYYSLEIDGYKADYRMKYWWEHGKRSMLKSYLYFKPKTMIYNSFYWDEMFHIPATVNYWFRRGDLLLMAFGLVGIVLSRKRIKETIFILSFYVFQIMVYCYSFAFDRYAQTLYFYRFIILGWGCYLLYQWGKTKYLEWRK